MTSIIRNLSGWADFPTAKISLSKITPSPSPSLYKLEDLSESSTIDCVRWVTYHLHISVSMDKFPFHFPWDTTIHDLLYCHSMWLLSSFDWHSQKIELDRCVLLFFQVAEYILDDSLKFISSSDSDSDSDEGPISRLWAYPRHMSRRQ